MINQLTFELLKAQLEIVEQLEVDYGEFLHSKQEVLSVHFQQLTVGNRCCRAEAAMVRNHQCCRT